MKIIHTADWHIGKILYGLDLKEDHELFFDWLCTHIIETNADVLLVSGDIFDHSNPTNDAQKTYYKAITRLQKTGVQIILTGGNHDSAMRLNSSEDLLNLVGIDIVGGVPTHFDEQIIPLKNRAGEVRAICGAVPFLRDRDVKEFISGETTEDRVHAIRLGIYKHYEKLKERKIELHGAILPLIAMGHLFMQGASTSPEEREIQLGNQAGLEVTKYQGMFDYFALGHIHIPFRCGDGIRYSGSPIPLDFSEYKHDKIIIEISIEGGTVKSKSVKIPVFRSYLSLNGNWDEIKETMQVFTNPSQLKAIYNLNILSDVAHTGQIEDEIEGMRSEYLILKKKINPIDPNLIFYTLGDAGFSDIRDLDPKEVFLKRMEYENIPSEYYEQMILAHQEILNRINQAE